MERGIKKTTGLTAWRSLGGYGEPFFFERKRTQAILECTEEEMRKWRKRVLIIFQELCL